ncbi:MAG TPA: phosphoenolpyruvate synthase, partial [Candidatus Babeliales bacterium]|nr:phosphoenolpyruvate synthase [Candidatus Babeliales bacterium]
MKFIKKFSEISINDVSIVGGKNASIGQMIQELGSNNIAIPQGFATTADSYWHFMQSNKLINPIQDELNCIKNIQDVKTLTQVSKSIRKVIEASPIPNDLEQEIKDAYSSLSQEYDTKDLAVAVRSSATAEDLPTASFAGQQETFLNVTGPEQLLESYKKCISSLFTARAIAYRIEQGFEHDKVALSVGIQKMINAKSAGVSFTLDTETGFDKVVMINSAWGLGETVVKGIVNPDTFYVYKPTLAQDCNAVIRKQLGNKKQKLIYGKNSTTLIDRTTEELNNFSLSQDLTLQLAKQSVIIEKHYKKPMDIEWAVDSDDKLFIVQARPETVHSQKDPLSPLLVRYTSKENPSEDKIIVQGQSIGQAIISGKARVITNIDQIGEVQKDEILVTHMTDPDWVPVMRLVAGIITNVGGRTCHAAIVSRELGVPAIVGAYEATNKIKTGDMITLDCSQGQVGTVFQGKIAFEKYTLDANKLDEGSKDVMLNMSDPSQAFSFSFLPVAGVGLARIEFIFANSIKLHPMALIEPEKVTDKKDQEAIANITRGYNSDIDYFIDTLAQEVATIAAAFNPRPVIVRFSDLK